GGSEGGVAISALLLGQLGLAEAVAGLAIGPLHRQLQLHVLTGEVEDRRNLGEQLPEALVLEPLERLPLDRDEVRDRLDLSDLGKVLSLLDRADRLREHRRKSHALYLR